jgi:hypothetical protein
VTFEAETVAPKLVIVTEQEVPQLPTVPEPLPRAAFPEPTRVTESVSPEHAVGIPATFTCVTFPLLSTLRVAEREDVHAVTLALPAEREVEPIASVAAAAHAVNVAATASANPTVLERCFISVLR